MKHVIIKLNMICTLGIKRIQKYINLYAMFHFHCGTLRKRALKNKIRNTTRWNLHGTAMFDRRETFINTEL